MWIYIHKEIGFYELEDILGDNFKVGDSEYDYMNNAFVLLNSEQIDFKNENPEANPLEVFHMSINIYEKKRDKIKEIDDYDKSDEVNCFYVNGQKMWIDRDTRVSLYHTASILNSDTIRIWTKGENPIYFDLPVDLCKTLLQQLEQYAKSAYDTTALHKYNVNQLTIYEEIKNYNYKSNYPEKINITI